MPVPVIAGISAAVAVALALVLSWWDMNGHSKPKKQDDQNDQKKTRKE